MKKIRFEQTKGSKEDYERFVSLFKELGIKKVSIKEFIIYF